MNSESQFEQTLADLSFASLQDKAPGLVDYIVGYQVLDTNDDQTKAVGTFGCKVNDEWIYVPNWFINGELRDGLMYLRNQDLFVPLSEPWIQYVLNRKPYQLGETTSFDKKDLHQHTDLYSLKRSPESFGKASSSDEDVYLIPNTLIVKDKVDVPVYNSNNLHPNFNILEELDLDTNSSIYKSACSNLDVTKFFESIGNRGLHGCLTYIKNHEKLANLFFRYYNVEDLKGLPEKIASSSDRNTDKSTFENSKDPAYVTDEVSIITWENKTPEDYGFLTDEEKKQLMRGEIVIKDNRTNKSKVYNANIPLVIDKPAETATYNVISMEGEPFRCFILKNFISLNRYDEPEGVPYGSMSYSSNKRDKDLIINLDGKGFCKKRANDYVAFQEESTLMSNLMNSETDLKDLSSLKEGSCYAIVTPSGNGTDVFRVLKKKKKADGQEIIYVSDRLRKPKEEYDRERDADLNDNIKLKIDQEAKNKIHCFGRGSYVVGPNCKVIKVNVSDKISYSDDPEFPPLCSRNTIEELIFRGKNFTPLKLFSQGTEIELSLDEGGETKKSSYSYLGATRKLLDLGIDGEEVKGILKEASAAGIKRKSLKYLLKVAAPYDVNLLNAQYGMNIEPSDSVANSYGDVPGNVPVLENLDIPGLNQSYDSLYDPDPRLDEDIFGAVEQAAATGQKEIFDTAMLSSLVKTIDSGDMVERYLGDLILGMDRIGRIYFLFLQKNEEFKESYGQEDLIELEDQLKNTFKSVGDLILSLKQKTVEQGASEDRTRIY